MKLSPLSGVQIILVEAGTEFPGPNGSVIAVTDNTTVWNGWTAYVTKPVWDALCERARVPQPGDLNVR